jgi:predicted nucleotidyltransferase
MNSASKKPMKKSTIIRLLEQEKPFLVREFGVAELALFGSVSRDGAESGSDVDILVSFDGPATSKRYFGVQFHLEDLLGHPVDLVTEKALRPELRPYIESEAVYVR